MYEVEYYFKKKKKPIVANKNLPSINPFKTTNMCVDIYTHYTIQRATELCGFVTILSGTFLLHKTKDMGNRTQVQPPVYGSPSHNT